MIEPGSEWLDTVAALGPQPGVDETWIERCMARVLALGLRIDAAKAHDVVTALSNRHHWRKMDPEAAAEELCRSLPGRHPG